MSRALAAALCALLLAFASGCGDDDPTGPAGSVQGTWRLRIVDEARLPSEQFVSSLVRPSNCDVQTLQGSLLTLRADESFTITFDLDIECDGTREDREVRFDGTYVRTGGIVELTTVSLIELDAVVGPHPSCGGPALSIRDTVFDHELLYCPT